MNQLENSVSVGQQKMAVFDFDETLVQGKTMFDFLRFFLSVELGKTEGATRAQIEIARLRDLAKRRSRSAVNREFYRFFKGRPKAKIEEIAAKWFRSVNEPSFYHSEILDIFRAHKAAGAQTVILSGSAKLFLAPFADHLRADHLLAIDLEVNSGGILTGEISGIQTIGDGKLEALEALLDQFEIRPELFGYGDHQSDIPFLEICDHPAFIMSSPAEWGANIPPRFERIPVF